MVSVTSFIDYYGLQSVAWRVIWGLCVCLMIGQLVLSFPFLSTHSVLDAGLQQHVWAVQYSKKAT